ncbi:DUF2273 domain-containing protein [Kroppenstedtia eburnea]|uniref:Small integral membrane protein n=1 Tax=Kroppenstedtia eburnea TaxID=714067 RepID=A0A1N7ILM3_9BACL|nr:DUF2273 domain-containing protein [Kroppenstedtia eburnea]EGK14333.1 hypothetical protein HMPREF9374_0294 [Desmospora sp. 8437]QKI81944.1 DUF2273 domain-containing protein [Kroppenstedtia eburnea]SIS37952.1 Small integral membrane protein [Kroppenstedtia eburnea]
MDRIWETHGGRIAGLIAGLLFGFIFLFVGFWKTLIFGFFVLSGYGVGQWMDSRGEWREVLEEIVPDKWFRK